MSSDVAMRSHSCGRARTIRGAGIRECLIPALFDWKWTGIEALLIMRGGWMLASNQGISRVREHCFGATRAGRMLLTGGEMEGIMIKKQLSRRAFLGFGATAAVVAGAGLAGCAPKAAESNESSLSATGSGNVADVTWEKEVDVVVVGYGGAGSAAAIEAKEAGAEVLLLEETKNPGGSTLACGGFIMMGGTKL